MYKKKWFNYFMKIKLAQGNTSKVSIEWAEILSDQYANVPYLT